MPLNPRIFLQNLPKSLCLRNYTTRRTSLTFNIYRYAQTNAIKCWKCGVEKKSVFELFCDQCNVIQSPQEGRNYFKVLGFGDSYDINSKELQKKYRQMQSVLHPDKFSTRSDDEKAISENYSALVNKAYGVLQSPLKRALHLLALKGERISEDQKLESPEFLMEIMELNEEVEEADTDEKLVELNAKNKKRLEDLVNEISECFKSNDVTKAKGVVIKLKYYWSVGEHINRLLRERGITD